MKSRYIKHTISTVLLSSLLMLTGCGSRSESDTGPLNVRGTFVDALVKGLDYSCSSNTVGKTDSNGEYSCKAGDDVTFSIGTAAIGTIAAQKDMITPYSLFPNDFTAAVNLARLLQSLDTDGNATNSLIDLDPTLIALLPAEIDFSSLAFDTVVQTAMGIILPGAEDAKQIMDDAIVAAEGTVPTGTHAPVANAGVNQNVETGSLVTLDATLSSDADLDALTYTWTIIYKPEGSTATLSDATAIKPTFTVDIDGTYVFGLVANDGTFNSAMDTVIVLANTQNSAPVANSYIVNLYEDIPTTITLSATDVDGDTLTYSVVTAPAHGTFAGSLYTPDPNYNGTDSFTFKANDGTVDSQTATVSLTITAVQDAPVATVQSIILDEDTPATITLSGTDVDGDTLTYSMVTAPAHGTFEGSLYTPDLNYNGTDSFTFLANDGIEDSPTATVSLTVSAVNDAPVAAGQEIILDEDIPTTITLSGTDIDGDILTYSVVTAPAHGTFAGSIYTPDPNYNGTDSFTFVANDGTVDSPTATVSITVSAVNDAPVVAAGQEIILDEDTPTTLTLGTDVDGDTLTYIVVTAPAHGTFFAGSVYTPDPNYNGTDSFTFIAYDGTAAAPVATVNLIVSAVNDAPVATPQKITLDENASATITLSATDIDGDTLTYSVVAAPVHGTFTGSLYTPDPNYVGLDSFTFIANDGTVDSPAETVGLTIAAIGTPTASDFNVTLNIDYTYVGADWKILSSANDPDGDILSASIVTDGNYGTFYVKDNILNYNETIDGNSTDTAILGITDGNNTVQITVTINRLYWKQVSAGANHTAAVRSDGTLWSWGANGSGQLGDNTTVQKLVPTQEYRHDTDWTQISAGNGYTAAIKSDGTLWAWGYNAYGQLGEGTTLRRLQPNQETTHSTTWKQVSAGYYHTAAVRSDGTLWSWGGNGSGQLGDGTTVQKLVPTQEYRHNTDWKQVSAGANHTTAVRYSGTLWAWGRNNFGQLGDGTTVGKLIPRQEVMHDTNWEQVSAGASHTVAFKRAGRIWAWGNNDTGQLGIDSATIVRRLIPTLVAATLVTDWKQVSAGADHTAAVRSNGTLWAWGLNNLGQLGDGTTSTQILPTPELMGDMDWYSVNAGNSHTAAVKSDGTIWTWGSNNFGQLSDKTTNTNPNPDPTRILTW